MILNEKGIVVIQLDSTLDTFSLIIEGASKKGIVIKMPMVSINNKNFCLREQIYIFLTLP